MLLPLKLADKLGSKHTGCELDGKSRPSLRSVSFFQIKKRTLLIDLLGRPRRPVVVIYFKRKSIEEKSQILQMIK